MSAFYLLDDADFWLLENDPAWQGKTAQEMAWKRFRDYHVQGGQLGDSNETLAPAADEPDYVESKEEQLLQVILAALKPRDQEIVTRIWNGEDVQYVAKSTGKSFQAVYQSLSRSLPIARRALSMRVQMGVEA